MEKEITKGWFTGFIEGERNFQVVLRNTKDV